MTFFIVVVEELDNSTVLFTEAGHHDIYLQFNILYATELFVFISKLVKINSCKLISDDKISKYRMLVLKN